METATARTTVTGSLRRHGGWLRQLRRFVPVTSNRFETPVFVKGVKQGREDRRKRNNNGYKGQSTYQKATKDYSSGLGDREVFQRYFREAYEHGYADGYAGY